MTTASAAQPSIGMKRKLGASIPQTSTTRVEQIPSCGQVCPLCGIDPSHIVFLCHSAASKVARDFFSCSQCRVIFVPKNQHVSAEQERERYALHQNDASDLGYQQFLRKLVDPLRLTYLLPRTSIAIGLDFGCGPGPCISPMLVQDEAQVVMINYDPLFFPDPPIPGIPVKDGSCAGIADRPPTKSGVTVLGTTQTVQGEPHSRPPPSAVVVSANDGGLVSDFLLTENLHSALAPPATVTQTVTNMACMASTAITIRDKTSALPFPTIEVPRIPAFLNLQYDFITCTEVVEHLAAPLEVFAQLFQLLVPGGVLAIMTGVCDEAIEQRFSGWHYHRDFTHITFYRPHTLDWLSQQFEWKLSRPHRDVAFFTRLKT
jgi:hypothetical protein